MAWFHYGDQPVRRNRLGIWLRVSDQTFCESAVGKTILEKVRPGEQLQRVVVKELKPNNRVLLEVWCLQEWPPNERYGVFYAEAAEDPAWVCESDLGRGLVVRRAPVT